MYNYIQSNKYAYFGKNLKAADEMPYWTDFRITMLAILAIGLGIEVVKKIASILIVPCLDPKRCAPHERGYKIERATTGIVKVIYRCFCLAWAWREMRKAKFTPSYLGGSGDGELTYENYPWT